MAESAISAGDVGRFVYCPMNWKLYRDGHPGTGGKKGKEAVEELSGQVDALEHHQGRAVFTLQSSFYLALMATASAAIGVEVLALRASDEFAWWTLLFLSVVWLAMSLYLFAFHLYYGDRAGRLRSSRRLVGGSRIDLSQAQKTSLFESRILPLRGRPDLLVQRDGAAVPVVVKAGHSPPSPYESHAVQLAAYCYLVGESTGRRPPVGILAYPDRQFEVGFSRELEDRLLQTLLRIQLAQRTGSAHRDHENPRRCAGCSRRDICQERLT